VRDVFVSARFFFCGRCSRAAGSIQRLGGERGIVRIQQFILADIIAPGPDGYGVQGRLMQDIELDEPVSDDAAFPHRG